MRDRIGKQSRQYFARLQRPTSLAVLHFFRKFKAIGQDIVRLGTIEHFWRGRRTMHQHMEEDLA